MYYVNRLVKINLTYFLKKFINQLTKNIRRYTFISNLLMLQKQVQTARLTPATDLRLRRQQSYLLFCIWTMKEDKKVTIFATFCIRVPT